MTKISGWMLVITIYFLGEVKEWWNVFGDSAVSTPDGWTEDQLASACVFISLGLAFIAWAVEQVCLAIRNAGTGKEDDE